MDAREGDSMTTTQIPTRMVVSATVKTRGEAEDGYVLELDIAEFRSNYPTKVTRVKEPTAKLLAPRPEPYSVVLVRQALKKGKEGKWHSDYFWGLEGLATPAETQAKAAAVASEPPAQPAVSDSYWEEHNRTIEAEWAINQARELMQWEETDAPHDGRFMEREALVSNALWFWDVKNEVATVMRSGVRLATAPSPSEATAGPVITPETQDAAPSPADGPSPYPTNVGELLTRAKKELGYESTAAAFKMLGIASATEIASQEKLIAAWDKLVKERPFP